MLKKIDIRNYRSCVQTNLDLDPHLSVLIGPNGSGKTNLLQAVMLLHKLANDESVLRDRPASPGVPSRLGASFSFEKAEANLNASMELSPDESNRDVLLSSQQSWKLKSRSGREHSSDLPLLFSRPSNSSYYRLFLGSRHPSEDPKWAVTLMRKTNEFCQNIRYYGASQFTNPGTCPISFSIEEDGRRSFRDSASGHVGMLRKIYRASKSPAESGYERFLEVVGKQTLGLIDALEFEEVKTSSVDYTVRVGGKLTEKTRQRVLVIPRFRIGRQTLSPNQLSEGTFKTLVLLFNVLTDTSSLLLVEEPEVCVHQGLLSSILEIIKSASISKQIVISTHSDYVLDHVSPENVIRVTKQDTEGTIASHLTDALSHREYAALREYLATSGNLGDYWREGGLGDRP